MGDTPQHPNIKVGLEHPAVALMCTIPPRHLIQLKTLAIPLSKPKVGKNFAVLRYVFALLMGVPSEKNPNIKVGL